MNFLSVFHGLYCINSGMGKYCEKCTKIHLYFKPNASLMSYFCNFSLTFSFYKRINMPVSDCKFLIDESEMELDERENLLDLQERACSKQNRDSCEHTSEVMLVFYLKAG